MIYSKRKEILKTEFLIFMTSIIRAINLDTEAKSRLLLNDTGFANSLSPTGLDLLLNFADSLPSKRPIDPRRSINSLAYNYIYNEMGKKAIKTHSFWMLK